MDCSAQALHLHASNTMEPHPLHVVNARAQPPHLRPPASAALVPCRGRHIRIQGVNSI